MKTDQNNDDFSWINDDQPNNLVFTSKPVQKTPEQEKLIKEILSENPDSTLNQESLGFSDFKIDESAIFEPLTPETHPASENEQENSESIELSIPESAEAEQINNVSTPESNDNDDITEDEAQPDSSISVPDINYEESPSVPENTVELQKNQTNCSNWFNLFKFNQESSFLEAAKQTFTKEQFKQNLKNYNLFFNNRKNLFPLLNKQISLFELFILKYFIDLVPNEQALLPKYVVQLNFDNLRAPAKMTKFWSKGFSDIKFSQNNDTQIIYFDDEPSAKIVANKIKSIESSSSFPLLKTKSQPMNFKEDSAVPLNNQTLIEFPMFAFENQKNVDIIGSFQRLEDLINLKTKNSNKNIVKAININEWTKSKWINYLKEIWDNRNILLSKKELSRFEFDTPENIYSKLLLTKPAESGKFMVIIDFSFLKKELTKSSINSKISPNQEIQRRVSSPKYLSQLKEIYELIFYSWIRFFIKPQNETQLKEQFSYNMYSFISDSKILNPSSSYLFKPELFLSYTPWAKTPDSIQTGEEFEISKKSIEIKATKPEPFNLDQLNLLFAGHNISWMDSDLMCKAISGLCQNEWIKVSNFKLYINQEISFYFNSLKSQESDVFFKNVKEMFSHFWPKDVQSFFEKLEKILTKPF